MRGILCILILYMALCAGAQKPRISFPDMEYDFGEIQELGGVVQYRFVYTNTGDRPLILTNVKTTCGCTSPAWSKEPVLPGKAGYIDVQFDPRDRTGSFVKSIIVSDNTGGNPTTLYISGSVVPRPQQIASEYPYTMDDLRLKSLTVNLGKVLSNASELVEIFVANPSGADIVLSPCDDTPAYIQLDARPKVLKPGAKGVLRVKFDAARYGGFALVKEEIPLCVGAGRYMLHLRGFVEEYFTEAQRKSPPKIRLLTSDTVRVSCDGVSPANISIGYENTGLSPLAIRSVYGGSGIQWPGTVGYIMPGHSGSMELTVSPGESRLRTISIYTNIPDAQPIRLCLAIDNITEQ